MNHHRMSRAQLIAVAVVILLVLGSAGTLLYQRLSSSQDRLMALVSINGVDICTVDLSKDADPYEIDLDEMVGVPVVLEVRDHAIRFQHSDCPDQICVHAGWLSKEMDIAICMPNQTTVVVYPASELKEVLKSQ